MTASSAQRRTSTTRIGLDLTFLSAQLTGLGVYGLNLVRGLAQGDDDMSYVVFISQAGRPYLPALPANFTVVTIPVPYALRFGSEQFAAPLFLRQRLDVLHSPSSVAPVLYRDKFVTTVHDITYARAAQTMTPKSRFYFGTLLGASARRARRVITVSRTVREELCRADPRIAPTTIVAIPEAIDDRFFVPSDPAATTATLRRYHIQHPYILFVGTMEPRKNLGLVVRAFARLRAAGAIAHKLVLVGRLGWLAEPLIHLMRDLDLERDIIQTGYVPDEDLPSLYRRADLFVFPSIYEGFGLPPVEAMACGTPVIVSAIPVLQEVGGDAAVYVDPHCVEELCQAIRTVLTDPDVRMGMVERGLEQSQRHRVGGMARATAAVYRTVVRMP